MRAKVQAAINLLPDTAVETEGPVHSDSLVKSRLLQAINPDDYACEQTAFSKWAQEHVVPTAVVERLEYLNAKVEAAGGDIEALTPEEQDELARIAIAVLLIPILDILGAISAPTYDAIINADDPRFQVYGEGKKNEAKLIKGTVEDANEFWDNPMDIHVAAMKDDIVSGSSDTDHGRYGAAIMLIALGGLGSVGGYQGVNERTIKIGKDMKEIITYVPWFEKGESAIFTLNAFALDPEGEDGLFGTFGKQIVYGDGLLEAQDDLGYKAVGPAVVVGHEYAHQLQYSIGVFDDRAEGPEATRRTELMADAFAGYYGNHRAGLNYSKPRVAETARMFNDTGDCSFDSDGHHGTPNQGERAALWGAEQAEGQMNHHRTPSRTLWKQFDAVLPQIVAPDAS